MITLHDAFDTHGDGSRDTDHKVEVGAMVETAIKEDGTLQPAAIALFEIARHGWMYHIIHCLLVGLAGEDKLGKHGLLQDAIGTIHLLAHQLLQVGLQVSILPHQPLSPGIAVVNPDAVLLQDSAHIALSATYAPRYSYLHHSRKTINYKLSIINYQL